MKNNKAKDIADYTQLKSKMFFRFCGIGTIALAIMTILYLLFWHNRGGNAVLWICQNIFNMSYKNAYTLYQIFFRNNESFIWLISVVITFFILLCLSFNWFIKYFTAINKGIDALLTNEDTEILLPPEMQATERKLNIAKQTLKQRAIDVQLAEQRKNDLVIYLAHDIRTPLTSVIGYLSLLEESPDMPTEQKAKYVHIALEKAYRLERMINEFFEITRYNLQQISISKQSIDLYYMLIQLSDELSSFFLINGNTVTIHADENLHVYGDPDKLARVFNNVLKNAAAYSYPNSEIVITAIEKENMVVITFQNKGETIPKAKLASIFEKFYRLNEARTSSTGGAGLGLAIAKEITVLHGGTIIAVSENETITFTITLPIAN